VWKGVILMIDWANPVTGNTGSSGYMYDSSGKDESEMSNSSKYPFYVELENAEGLLLGQHVYIEPDYGTDDGEPQLALSSSFFFDVNGSSASVWAEGKNGKLEKRSVTLGEYDEMNDTYVVTSGLTAEDYIAYPIDGLKAGMVCDEFSSDAFDSGDSGYEGGYEEEYTEESYTEEGYTGEETPAMPIGKG